jgi:hypothetical protein
MDVRQQFVLDSDESMLRVRREHPVQYQVFEARRPRPEQRWAIDGRPATDDEVWAWVEANGGKRGSCLFCAARIARGCISA